MWTNLLAFLFAGSLSIGIETGVIIIVRTSHEDMVGGGVSQSGLRQNKMMWRRVQFQALAVVFVILFLLVARGHAA